MKVNKKFINYVKSKFKTYQEMSEFFGKSRATVYFWVHGKAIPNYKNMQMITKKTKNAVPMESWFV